MAKEKNKVRNIGIDVVPPTERCEDKNCPFHGSLGVRGNVFTGTVIKADMQKTAIIEWERWVKVPKYERFTKKRTKLKAHNPECINAKPGDKVKIAETRPLSKTKHFVIIEKVGKELHFQEKADARAESQVPKKEKAEENSPKTEQPKEEKAEKIIEDIKEEKAEEK